MFSYQFSKYYNTVVNAVATRGWTALINDNLIANVFQLSVIVLALLSAAAGYILGSIWHPSEGSAGFAAFLALCGGVSGAAFGLLLSSVLDSACAMVFVAYAEDPDALKVEYYVHIVHLIIRIHHVIFSTVFITSKYARTYVYSFTTTTSSWSCTAAGPGCTRAPSTGSSSAHRWPYERCTCIICYTVGRRLMRANRGG
jgi:hypothetical protein